MEKALFVSLQLSLGTVACLYSSPLLAQVTSDGTVNTQVNQNGNVAEITGGATRGSNLFHSFQDFSVPTGNEAFFDNANAIENIFSRVTGGNISDINGTIRANGSASLFLINPAGIIFGENARLDIGGSFYGSGASGILFEDGEFSATDLANPPLLTINAPIGLNLRDNPGNISHRSTNLGLQVNPGKTISFTGNEVSLDGGIITAPQGRVEVLGDKVSLINNAAIDVSSETGGGTVLIGGDYQGRDALINATRTYIDNTVTINADAFSEGNGGRVIVWGDEVTGFYGNISVRGGDISGNGGFVEVSGKEHLIFRGNVDTTATNGFTGTLLLDPTNIIIANGSGDSVSDGDNTFAGNNSNTPGSILSTPLSEIDDDAPTTIFESELEGLSGDTNIILQATNDITLQDLADDELTLAAGSGVIAFTADADADGVGDFVMEDNTVVFDNEIFQVTDPADTIKTNGRSIAISGANLTIGNINTSFAPPDLAGDTLETALITNNSNSGTAVNNLTGTISEPGDVDLYQIFITGGGTFSATTLEEGEDTDFGSFNNLDTALYLFDANGIGVYANDDQAADFNDPNAIFTNASTLPANNPLTPNTPGIYFLAVTGSEIEPVSENGGIFPNANNVEINVDGSNFNEFQAIKEGVNAPTEEGGTLPLSAFNSEFPFGIGEYNVTLTGVEGIQNSFSEPTEIAPSGSITLNATNGSINAANLDTSNDFDAGNDITLTATQNVDLISDSSSNISTSAGNLTIDAGEQITITNNIDTSDFNRGTAGDININAGEEITIAGNFINATAFEDFNPDEEDNSANSGGSVSIVSGSTTTLTNSDISTNSFSFYNNDNSQSGGITITGESVVLNNTRVDSSSSDGEAGDVEITATDGAVRLTGIEQNPEDNFGFTSDTISTQTVSYSFFGNENDSVGKTGGDITITGNLVVIDNYNLDARVGNQYSGGLGDGGDITITGESIDISNKSDIATDTRGIGNAGSVLVEAINSGSFEITNSSITTGTEGQGNAGNITINAGSISINENALIIAEVGEESLTFGENAVDSELFLFDEAGNLLAENDISDPTSGGEGSFSQFNSFIEFNFEEDGTYIIGVGAFESFVENGEIAGNRIASGQDYTLQVSLENQPVSEGDGLLTKIEPNDSLGNAQNLNNSFSLNEDPNIQDSTSIPHVSISASGNGTFDYYSFNAESGSLGIFDIDEIAPDGMNTEVVPGNILAGNINLNATNNITISNDSEVSASTSGRGIGGSINLTAPNLLSIRDNSTVRVDSDDSATGGTLTINAGSLALENEGQILAETELGTGGLLDINVENILSLRDDSRISAVATEDTGDAGDIDINAGFVIAYPNLEKSNGSDIETSARSGSGGDITITTEALLGLNTRRAEPNNNTNDIDVVSDSGLSGDFSLSILNIDLIESATKLAADVVEPERITAQTCTANRKVAAQSGLAINGRGGVATSPGSPLNSDKIIIGTQTNESVIIPAPVETSKGKIQPARGVTVTESGEIILTAYRTNNSGNRLPETRHCSGV